MMDAKVKTKWVDALRSGEYKQASGVLRDDNDAFCCLGVLCDVAVKEGLEITVFPPPTSDEEADSEEFSTNWGGYGYGSRYDDEVLPGEVREWAGLDDNSPEVPRQDTDPEVTHSYAVAPEVALADLNDRGMTFNEIADRIEAYL